jgi:23S rRNA (adenine2030-N6)-methyltransferase
MPYSHFGKYADVFKHLIYCEVLRTERPRFIVESNAAYAQYELTNTPEQTHGIATFLRGAGTIPILSQSVYFRLQAEAHSNATPTYLGSPGLALTTLPNAGFEYYDLDPDALQSIAEFASERAPEAAIVAKLEDSRKAMSTRIGSLPGDALVFLDPYEPFEADAGGCTIAQSFFESVERGLRVLMWMGFNSLPERDALRRMIAANVTTRSGIREESIHLKWRDESTEHGNPGVLGCSMLMANLTEDSCRLAAELTNALADVYESALIAGSIDSGLAANHFVYE